MIAGVDFEIATNIHFQLELDKEQGIYFAMRYNAVIRCADEMDCSFSLSRLPAYALSNSADNILEVETVDEDGDYVDDYITHTLKKIQQKTSPK